jgi:hypothetical protein
MFKKGEMPFKKGGKEDEDRKDESRKGKRKKSKRMMMRMAKGR